MISVAGHVIKGDPVFSGTAAINIRTALDDFANTEVLVRNTGVVEGRAGIYVSGLATKVVNNGEVYRFNVGIQLGGVGSGFSDV